MFLECLPAAGNGFAAEGAEFLVLVESRGGGFEHPFKFLDVDVVCFSLLILYE